MCVCVCVCVCVRVCARVCVCVCVLKMGGGLGVLGGEGAVTANGNFLPWEFLATTLRWK